VGVTPTLPPMVFKRDGQLTGLEIDAARALGEHLGRPVRFVELKWEDQIESHLAGRTDINMSSMTITAERRMRLAFSNTDLYVGQLLLVRRADFNRYALGIPVVLPGTVGVIAGTVGEQFVDREFSGSNRRAFATTADAAEALKENRIDSLVSDAPLVWYQAAVVGNNGLGIVQRPLTRESLGWAVRPDDGELLQQVNGFIAAGQADGSLNAVIKRWLPLSN
jgi:ABC-type amino acid transport substrate-binding protein